MTGEQKLRDSNFIRSQAAPIAIFLIFQNFCAVCHTYFPKKLWTQEFVILVVCL